MRGGACKQGGYKWAWLAEAGGDCGNRDERGKQWSELTEVVRVGASTEVGGGGQGREIKLPTMFEGGGSGVDSQRQGQCDGLAAGEV